jgi:hypothetical protein
MPHLPLSRALADRANDQAFMPLGLSKPTGVSARPSRKPHGKTGVTVNSRELRTTSHRNYLIVGAGVMVGALPFLHMKPGSPDEFRSPPHGRHRAY